MESNWYESIEKYNLGLLPAEQAAQLEAAMRTDEALADAVRAHRAEWEMQELFAENRLRADIRQRFLESPPEPDIPKSYWNWLYRNWKYALPALLILGAAGFFIFKNTQKETPETPRQLPAETPVAQPKPRGDSVILPRPAPVAKTRNRPSLRQIALACYRTPESLPGIRGPSDDDTLALATKAFLGKNYRRALALLSKLPNDDAQEALLLRGHAHFGAGDFVAAARDFSDLEQGGIYRREAEWFGWLSRLAMPGADKGLLKSELDAIRQQAKHPYQKDAAAMWKRLFQ